LAPQSIALLHAPPTNALPLTAMFDTGTGSGSDVGELQPVSR
jgi:hypothetical protein